eukprot:4321666-Pyramimonas_sp.AAC.1
MATAEDARKDGFDTWNNPELRVGRLGRVHIHAWGRCSARVAWRHGYAWCVSSAMHLPTIHGRRRCRVA